MDHSKEAKRKKMKKEEEEEEEIDPFTVPLSGADRERVKKYLRPGDAQLETLVEVRVFPRLFFFFFFFFFCKKDLWNKRFGHALKRDARDRQMAAVRNADAEVLLPEESGFLEMDDAFRNSRDVSQPELKDHVDLRTANNSFSLGLDHFGPYTVSYTRNGKFCLLSGRKGHVAILDWKTKELVSETHVK
jgi:hypothetical protein